MNKSRRMAGFTIASTAAGLFAASLPITASAEEELVHCLDVNVCKGTSDCATANSACKGQNECKGQGFVAVTADICSRIGGKV